jgi:hypothetical protein
MPAATGGGGYGGTIVLDPTALRQTAGVVRDGADAYRALAAQLNGIGYPDMPPGVDGIVRGEVSAVAAAVAAEPARLVDVAEELAVRAFWGDIADKLAAGYELEGDQLTAFKALINNGELLRYAEPWQAELANAYAKELHDRDHPGGFLGFIKTVGGGIKDFAVGAWDSVAQPALMLYHLTPLASGWTDAWGNLGHGLAYGVTHPVEFGKAVIGVDALKQHGFAYWLGNLAPSVAAAFFTGGGAAGLRAASATDRAIEGATAADRLDAGLNALQDAGRVERFAGDARALDEASRVRPDWLRRLDDGNRFNQERAPFYEHNEVYVDKQAGQGYYRLDSYDTQAREIVSRKYTQLGDVQESTGARYLNELDAKYAPGTRIADVPSTADALRGRLLQGKMVLEVPVQSRPIPQSVLDLANELDIKIRDVTGHVYNPLGP